MSTLFSGVAQKSIGNVGEFLSPSSPVDTILKLTLLCLRLEVPERETCQIRVKRNVRVTVESGH